MPKNTKNVRDPKIALTARKLLKNNQFLYSFAGNLYHNIRFLRELLYLKINYPEVKMLHPSFASLKTLKRSNGFRSQFGQDYFLVKLGLLPEKNGSFLDIGCNHPENDNNTFYLEQHLAYKGICIDPIADESKYAELRPSSKFLKVAVSNVEGEIDFVEVIPSGDDDEWHSMLSGSLDTIDLAERKIQYSVKKVPTVSLESILSNYFSSPPDIMSVDVEGHEINVLGSCSWTNNKPRVILLENVGSIEKQSTIRNFLISQGYRFYARIWISDDVFVLDS